MNINRVLMIAIFVLVGLIAISLVLILVFDKGDDIEICSCTEDLNCGDFATQTEAQACFEYCGGIENDVHRLDANKDGVVCESLG